MQHVNWFTAILLILGLALSGCMKELSYEEWLEKEMSSGIEQNDIFLQMDFMMEPQEFFDLCTELNRQQLIIQGPGGLSVQYEPEELDHDGVMRFYPAFAENRIAYMPVIFEYRAWAPWNKETQSDQLLLDVLDLFESWYGEGFRVIDHPNYGKGLVKIDGNREVVITIKDDRMVKAWITDLRMVEAVMNLEAPPSEY